MHRSINEGSNSDFDEVIDSYIVGNKKDLFDYYESLSISEKESFLDYLKDKTEVPTSASTSIFHFILKQLI